MGVRFVFLQSVELTVESQPKPIHRAKPVVLAALIAIRLIHGPARDVDADGAQRFGRKWQWFGANHFKRGAFGLFAIENIQQDARAESRGADAETCVSHDVRCLSVMRRSPKRTDARATVYGSAPGVREANPFELEKRLEEVFSQSCE